MAAYEVLLLNTAIPQIQAAQSGDTYVVPRDIAFSAALTLSAGTANGVPYLNGSKVVTTGSVLTFNGSTQLGIISASNAAYYAQAASGSSARINLTQAGVSSYIISTGPSDALMFIRDTTQAMTLNASGNLGIGGTNPGARVHSSVSSSGATSETLRLDNPSDSTNAGTKLTYRLSGWSYEGGFVSLTREGSSGGTIMAFGTSANASTTNAAERARITSGGYFKASNDGVYDSSTGAYHEVRQTANDLGFLVSATNSAFTSVALRTKVTATAAGTGFYHIDSLDSAATRIFGVRGDGNTYNTNGTFGTFSDQKLKQDIGDVESQWDDIKAIRFRKYRLKSQVAANPDAPALLGVVAQELEQTSPGLVDETPDRDADGNDLGTTTKSVKTSVLLMKAAVALQEAMARIEQLEAKVAAMGA